MFKNTALIYLLFMSGFSLSANNSTLPKSHVGVRFPPAYLQLSSEVLMAQLIYILQHLQFNSAHYSVASLLPSGFVVSFDSPDLAAHLMSLTINVLAHQGDDQVHVANTVSADNQNDLIFFPLYEAIPINPPIQPVALAPSLRAAGKPYCRSVDGEFGSIEREIASEFPELNVVVSHRTITFNHGPKQSQQFFDRVAARIAKTSPVAARLYLERVKLVPKPPVSI
ncbi:MAG: hypothetical protein V4534_02365 [Myxococcota bacterium]